MQVVPVDARGAGIDDIPGVGRPLYLKEPETLDFANTYRGDPTIALATSSEDSGSFVAGIVWHIQPAQRLRHRDILLIAIVTAGAVRIDPEFDTFRSLGDQPPGTIGSIGQLVFLTLTADHLIFVRPMPSWTK